MRHSIAAARRTRRGRIAMGLMALLLAYALFLGATDTARLLYYFLTVVLAVLGVRWLVQAFRKTN